MIELELHEETAAVTEPNDTELVPWVIPKLVPEIMTDAPAPPELTERDAIAGVGKTFGVNDSSEMKASLVAFRAVW
jgi:hypothetical protein